MGSLRSCFLPEGTLRVSRLPHPQFCFPHEGRTSGQVSPRTPAVITPWADGLWLGLSSTERHLAIDW